MPPPPDQQFLHLPDRSKEPGRVEADVLVSNFEAARIRHHILIAQRRIDLLRGNPQLGHLAAGHFDVDGFIDRAPVGDLGHVGTVSNSRFSGLGVVHDLGIGVPVAGDRQEDAVDIAVVVIDQRGPGSWRQLPLGVADLATQFIPDLGQGRLVVLVLHLGVDNRECRAWTAIGSYSAVPSP